METSVDAELRNEVLKLYFNEVKDTQPEVDFEDDEHLLLNEVEEANDFLQKAGLADLSKLYYEGKEIPDAVVNDSVRQRHLTEKQAQTVRSRVRTLNKTLRNRQPRRKQRQDIRDVTWNIETSSTGTRSRSATPDSLDSLPGLTDDLVTSDEDHTSIPHFPQDSNTMSSKGRLKLSSSEPLHSRFFRTERGDIAHLGSENVVLKGYQQLSEYGSLPRPQRERSGSDPMADVHINPLLGHAQAEYMEGSLSRSHGNLIDSCDKRPAENCEAAISFEGIFKQNSYEHEKAETKIFDNVNIYDLTDVEYQYLKPLLYVELTAIFDQYKISVQKRKANTKRKKGNVFGVNLSTLVMRDMPRPTDNSMVPQVYQSIINQLNSRCIREDGLLRIGCQKQKLEYLCKEIEEKFYNNRPHVEELLSQATGHELVGVLKKLLRELPDPVFSMELFDMFYKCGKIPCAEDKVKALNLLVLLLPEQHRNTFRLLILFMLNVIKHEKENRMSLHNVAMITAPSFFPPRLLLPKEASTKINLKSLTKEELERQINDAAVSCCLMEVLLNTGSDLWMVPVDLAAQARDAHRKAQNKKDVGRDKKLKYGKKKLARSSTQYEAGAIIVPRIKRELFI